MKDILDLIKRTIQEIKIWAMVQSPWFYMVLSFVLGWVFMSILIAMVRSIV